MSRATRKRPRLWTTPLEDVDMGTLPDKNPPCELCYGSHGKTQHYEGKWLCRRCVNERQRIFSENKTGAVAHRRNAIERERVAEQRALLRKYGMTVEDKETLLNEQGRVCALCGSSPDRGLCVDHDHTTGDVRGLLCVSCNTALGHLKDSTEVLSRAIEYLCNPPANGRWQGEPSTRTTRTWETYHG